MSGITQLSTWTSIGRPSSPSTGDIGFNTTLNHIDVCGNTGTWLQPLLVEGDTMSGGLYVTGAMTSSGLVYTPGQSYPNSNYASINITLAEPGWNSVPLVISFAPAHDRRGLGTNASASYSPVVITQTYADPTKGYGFAVLNGCTSLQTSVSILNSSDGLVNFQPEIETGLPTGYTDATLTAAYSGTPLLPVIECLNPVLSTTFAALDMFQPSSVHNSLALCEGDIQKNCIDDAGLVGGYTLNADVHLGPQYGGLWATCFHTFRSSGLHAMFVNYGLKIDSNVNIGVDTRGAVTPVATIVAPYTTVPTWATAAYTTALSNHYNGPAPAVPAAAPASIGGGSVIHVDAPLTGSPATPYNTLGGGIGGFVVGLVNGKVVSTGNPLPILINGNQYHVVGYQADGRWYEGGFLQMLEAIDAADTAVGSSVSGRTYGLFVGSGQNIGWDGAGAVRTYYDPTQFGGGGAVVTTSSAELTGSLSIATGQSLGGSPALLPFEYSPRDGGHTLQWNPYSNQSEFYTGGTTLELAIHPTLGVICPFGVRVTSPSGPVWTSGTGAPTVSQPKGSLWSRTDGGVGTTLYVSQGGGTWNPVAGV